MVVVRNGQPVPKLTLLLELMAAERWPEALRMAAGFGRLGAHKAPITRAWNALQRPGFYRQLGQDPDAHVQAGIAALKARYLSVRD